MSLITVHVTCVIIYYTDITEIIIMTGIVATVTGIIILYIKMYEDDEDSYPIQAVDQGENGILVFPQRY